MTETKTVPKGPTDTCFNCRADNHDKCDELGNVLCACNHRGHIDAVTEAK